ncbi:unnamed protein product [Musa hybrid cultivar]
MQSCLWTFYAAVFERVTRSRPVAPTLLAHFMQGLENKIPSLW